MNESNIFGISIRAYIVFIMVSAFVIMNFMKMDVDSTFSTLVVSLISFYFGNKTASTPADVSIDAYKPTVTKITPIVEASKL